MNFTFNNTQLDILRNKAKLFSYINNALNKVYFKVANNSFTILFRGAQGAMSTTIDIETDSDKPVYFSTNYSKWCNALLKFGNVDLLSFSINKNILKIYIAGTTDIINLGIISYKESDPDAIALDNFIKDKRKEIINEDFQLDLTEELIENFQMADSLFAIQGQVNSIGLSKNEVIYSDRSVVLKIHLLEELSNNLFSNLGDESYIFIHNYFLRLFPLLTKTNSLIYFSNDYDAIYWEDDVTQLLIVSESREIAIPTEEDWKGIKPYDEDRLFETPIGLLHESLDFFTGFYEETAWKPITFNIEANKQVELYYRHPTTEIRKNLSDITCGYSGTFMVGSDTLEKIISKVENRFSPEEPIEINFDDTSDGIYCKVGDVYEFVLSKLSDN